MNLYSTYIMGHAGNLLIGEPRPFLSFFRVHWRVLDIDGFHSRIFFNYETPIKYRFKTEAEL